MESSTKTRLPLHSIGIIYPSPSLRTTLHFWYNLHSYYSYQWRRKVKGLTKSLFWRLMPKGERVLAQSKRTAPPPNSKIFEIKFSIGIPLETIFHLVSIFQIDIFKGGFFQLVSKSFSY
jgi:hypothetical protein